MFAALAGPHTSTALLDLLAILFGGGGLLTVAGSVFMRWRKGPIDDALQLQQATDVARRAAGDLFDTYRVELEHAKEQLHEYLEKLLILQRDLGAAEARISRLEAELTAARVEVEHAKHLRGELEEARRRRSDLQAEVDVLRDRIRTLEATFKGG